MAWEPLDQFVNAPFPVRQELACAAAEVIRRIEQADPGVGIVLLDCDREVLWVNELHYRKFGIERGSTCFHHYNQFKCHCRWCTADETFEKGVITVAHALSPLSGRMEYSDLIFIPVRVSPDANVELAVEVVIYTTDIEESLAGATTSRYYALSKIGSMLREVENLAYALDLTLFGALTFLDFDLERVELLRTVRVQNQSIVCDHRTMSNGEHIHRAMENMKLDEELSQPSIYSVHAAFSHAVRCTSPVREVPLSGDFKDAFDIMVKTRRPARLPSSFAKAAGLISIPKEKDTFLMLVVEQAVQGNSNDFISDKDIAQLYLYCVVVSEALTIRRLNKDQAAEERRLVDRLLAQGDEEKLKMLGMMAIALSHEVIGSARRVEFAVESLFSNLGVTMKRDLGLRALEVQAVENAKALQVAGTRLRGLVKVASPMRWSKVNVRKLLRKVLDSFDREFRETRITPTEQILCRSEELVIAGDEDKLRQVLVNIIQNAIVALDQTTVTRRLRVVVSADSDNVTLKIVDNGSGIEDEVLPWIWEPFYTTKGSNGMGIGLALVRRVVVADHGGQVFASSRQAPDYEYETCFTIILPRRRTER